MLEPNCRAHVNSTNRRQELKNPITLYHKAFNPAQAVLALYRRLGTWRAVAEELGGDYSPATWDLIAQGRKPSRHVENTLRRYLRLPPRGCSRWFDMRRRDVAWYLANRQPVVYGEVLDEERRREG